MNVIFSGKIDFFFAFRIQIESLRLRMSLSNSSMSFTSPRFSISYGFMNLLRIDWGDSDSILTSNENKIHTTKKMVYLKGADISQDFESWRQEIEIDTQREGLMSSSIVTVLISFYSLFTLWSDFKRTQRNVKRFKAWYTYNVSSFQTA